MSSKYHRTVEAQFKVTEQGPYPDMASVREAIEKFDAGMNPGGILLPGRMPLDQRHELMRDALSLVNEATMDVFRAKESLMVLLGNQHPLTRAVESFYSSISLQVEELDKRGRKVELNNIQERVERYVDGNHGALTEEI